MKQEVCAYGHVPSGSAAQKAPEKYRDLVVCIAGNSANFVELGSDLQNDIISRNENRF